MDRVLEKYPIVSICVFILVILLPNLDTINVTIMEARNFVTAREMVKDGNWILTTFNGAPRYQKPPLPTWITAFFGFWTNFKSVFALRLPTLFMIMLTGITTYLFSLNLLNNKTHSLFNALIVITSFYVIGITIEAPWDIYNHAFMFIGIYFLLLLFKSGFSYKNFLLAGLIIGFSFLSKGPISFYVLFLPFLIAYGIVFMLSKQNLKQLLSVILLALLIGGWWFLYVRFADPEAFLEITKKETGNWTSYNVRPFYYYWSFFTQTGIWTIPAFVGLLYPYLKDKVADKKAYTFSLIWVFISLILLSIIPEKKSRYLMPVLIPLAINTGFYIDYLIREFSNIKNKGEIIPVYFNFGLIGLIGFSFPLMSYYFLAEDLKDFFTNYLLASTVLLASGLSIWIFLIKKKIKTVFYLTVIFFGLLVMTALPLSKALIKNENYRSIKSLEANTNELDIYRFGSISPEMIWDYGTKIIPIDQTIINPEIFGLLTKFDTKHTLKSKFSEYNVNYQATFDLNPMAEGKKNYKDRLKTDYYILTKKQLCSAGILSTYKK
ncbi:MAG: phospholipid carrier-dependent glycosyltransferase [Bacteroidia bacterium]|nr:phospholipid carrier-dependent glycosyltransferase [Bacteroidia bacterium]